MFIGVDIGTTNVKAVLVDEAQSLLAEASMPLETRRPQANWSEQNPDDWLEAVKKAFLQLKSNAPEAFSATVAIGLSGQMHGLVPLDSAGKALRPCILHNDGRAAAQAMLMQQTHPLLSEETGVLCMPSFVAPKLLWLKAHEPDVIGSMTRFVMPKDYVRLWLSGETGTDQVDAAGAWMLDEARRDWSANVLSALDLPMSILPRLHESMEPVGRIRKVVAEQFGLPAHVLVIAGAGDAAAGSIGLGQISDGDAFISLGTSSQLFVTTDQYRPNVPSLVHAFAHALPGRWFQMAAMLNGASALAWWAQICGAEPGLLITEAEREGRQGELDFLPYLVGERTPHNNAAARGTFHGLSADSTRADMTLAVLQGVAFTLADARDALEASGTGIMELGIAGGGAKSDFWCQLIADAVDRPLLRYRATHMGPAFGAARLAQLGIQTNAVAAICTKPPIDLVLAPSGAAVEANLERLARWRSLYRAVSN